MFIEQEMTQKRYQAKLKIAGGLIDESRNKLNDTIDVFFEGTSFDKFSFALRSTLVDELELE